ncbi:MAG TPA: hypothetical protein VFS25_19240 [Chitinophaga sp.]|uniref:hypothetical protein n=1 Tax=Chitinophaga sp. TaxID=1869181 RepID=UPI002DBB44DB|nr:hypothetical protein [Chitinophaga sp.]HEU4554994.1 hypothetical protein [Chitinophaga sp.]
MRFLFLFVSLISLKAFGQISPNVILTYDSDTTFWADWRLKEIKKLNLLSPNEGIDFFRISSPKYDLELSSKSNKMIFHANEIWENKQTGECYIKSFELTSAQVKKIKQLIDSSGINEIPSDRYIKGWQHGFDGITYIIENKKKDHYSFKTYWTPSAQIKFKESAAISNFIDQLNEITGYRTNLKLFEGEIPFYGWTYEGSMVTIKVILNSRAYRKYKRMKKKQMRRDKNLKKPPPTKRLFPYHNLPSIMIILCKHIRCINR